jgi:glycolate oxidase iron-sulfur subunit
VSRTPAFDAVHPPDRDRIESCVDCGFCLPSCPTYLLWGEEMDSPRGRIHLMKAGLEERTGMTAPFVEHFDRCLGCLACVTACPSGVQYAPLIEATRAQIERRYDRRFGERLFRGLIFSLFPHPGRLRLALLPALVTQPIVRALRDTRAFAWLPRHLRALLEVAPPVSAGALFDRLPERTPAAGDRRLTVGLLRGCVQRLVFPQVNHATREVLAAEGCDVVAPAGQGCCGALSLHAGRADEARTFARRTIATFEAAGVDRVVVNAAGCGSSMKEYGELLKDDSEWAGRARAFAARVRDVHELLAEIGPSRAVRHELPLRVVYQDACHLAHGQRIRRQPRDLLREIPGLTLLEPAEAEVCCGSAGIYNLVEPETARDLGDRKARHLLAPKPDLIVSANPGCTLQIIAAARRSGRTVRVKHPIEVLAEAIRTGPRPRQALGPGGAGGGRR